MKLSKKGLMRLLDVAFDGDEFYQSNALQIEFEPDDFVGGCCQNGKDHVTLTVEEASNVWDSLVNLVSYVESIDGWMSDLVRDGQRNIDLIRNRVKKAEGNK